MCNIFDAYYIYSNMSDKYWYFHVRNPISMSTFFLTVDEVYNISSKKQFPNKSVKYLIFYTKDLLPLLHFQGKLALSIAEVPENIHF